MDIGRYFKSVIDVCGYFRSVTDICRYFVLVEFGGNLRLVDLSGFLRFLFGVKIMGYKTFLLAARGSK